MCTGVRGLLAVAKCDNCSPRVNTDASDTGMCNLSGKHCPSPAICSFKLGISFWGGRIVGLGAVGCVTLTAILKAGLSSYSSFLSQPTRSSCGISGFCRGRRRYFRKMGPLCGSP